MITASASAAIVPGQVVAREGEVPMGAAAAVFDIRGPFAESGGAVGFSGELVGGVDFIFREDQIIFLNSDDITVTLGNHEVAIGTAEGDLYVMSPSINGDDGIYANATVLGVDGGQAPGFAAGTDVTFISRPAMVDNGVAFWVMGIAPDGNPTTQNRALMMSSDATIANSTPVVQGGQTVGAFTIEDATGQEGVQDEFQASHDATHLIAVVDLTAGLNLEAVYVDDAIVAQEGGPSGDGVTNFEFIELVTINNAGNYAFTGDVTGATTADEYIVYNGNIIVREGDTVAGVTLPGGAGLRLITLDDNGNMAHMWGGGSLSETLFYSCGLGLSTLTSSALITIDDELDIDGDAIGDGITVEDFGAATDQAQRALGNDGSIYLEAQLSNDGGMTMTEGIIRLTAPPCCGNAVPQDGEDCDDGNDDNTDACIACVDAVCGDGFVLDGVEDCDTAGESATCDDDCTAVACGDGNINEAAGEECDDDGESETCDADCTAVACGDGTLNTTAGEVCDDGGESADCDDDCTAVTCGDSNANETAGEDCDDGGDSATCDVDCSDATCGDDYVNTMAGETCDDGGRSETCDADCTAVSCGDGFVNMSAGEECDGDGAGNGGETATCDGDCTDAVCGDNEVNDTAGEECEDGNKDDTDDCVAGCLNATCGDGFQHAANEECDDGNTDDGDGCSSTCVIEEEPGTSTGESSSSDSSGSATDITVTDSDGSSSGGPDTDSTSTPTSTSPTSTNPTTTSLTSPGTVTDSETDTDTDTGGQTGADGCSCTTDASGGRTLPAALLGLVFLGLARRRRRG